MSSVTPINKVEFFTNFMCDEVKEYESECSCLFRGVHGEIFYLLSKEQDAHYAIDVRIGDDWQQLAEGTLKANQLMIVDIAFFIPEARLRILPDAAPTYLIAEAYGYPTVFTRDRSGKINS